MRLLKHLTLLCGLVLTYQLAYAEPQNLYHHLQTLKQYHDTGHYEKDFQQVIHQASLYLQKEAQQNQKLKTPKKLAIILDIDETSLSSYHFLEKHHFFPNMMQIRQYQNQAQEPAFKPMLSLYQQAKQQGIAVIFLTGRPENQTQVTIKNLLAVGYHNWDGLYFRTPTYKKVTALTFKQAIREKIIQQGYQIIASFGDQESDFKGKFAGKAFKLPNPYYFIA